MILSRIHDSRRFSSPHCAEALPVRGCAVGGDHKAGQEALGQVDGEKRQYDRQRHSGDDPFPPHQLLQQVGVTLG